MSEKFFDAGTTNIRGLLDNHFYEIKSYQRPYSWGDEQILEFFDDVYMNFTNSNSEKLVYFMGSIVTSLKDNIYEVIDGQQRLTTFIILAKVISEYYGYLLINDDEVGQRDMSKEELRKFVKKGKMARARILRPQDLEAFENTIIDATNESLELIKQEDIKPKDLKKETDIKLRYKNAAKAIITELEKLTKKNDDDKSFFQNFVNYLFNDIYLVLITAKTPDTAIELFKIINDRGLDLEMSDVIKATMLHGITKSYPENYNTVHEDFEKAWNSLKVKCEESQISMTTLLILYQYYFYSANPRISLTKSFDKHIMQNVYKGDGWELIKDISSFADSLPSSYKSNDSYLLAMNYLPWNTYWRCILATAKKANFAEYNELVRLLCCFYYVSWIFGGDGNTIKQQSFRMIEWVGGRKYSEQNERVERRNIDEIKAELMSHIQKKYLKGDNKTIYLDKIREILISSDLYGEKWLKPLLMLLHYIQKTEHNRLFLPLDGNELEHIVPRNRKQEEYPQITDWESFDKESLNSIGNLTLLEKGLNIRASNKDNKTKIEIYNNSEIGQTNFAMTIALCNLFKGNGLSEEVLKTRRDEVAEMILERIGI